MKKTKEFEMQIFAISIVDIVVYLITCVSTILIMTILKFAN